VREWHERASERAQLAGLAVQMTARGAGAAVDDDEQMQLLGKHPAEVCAVLLQYAILSPPRDTLACRATVRGGWVETRYRQNLCGMWRAIEPVRGRFQTYDACRV
jgi:hypothetical protein